MKNILITGCSSGIGLQTALTLKENDYKVYASARKEEDVEMLRNLGFETFKIDVRNKEEITNAIETIIKNDIKLDAVFNNAGYGQPGAVEDLSVETLREQFDTNFFGFMKLLFKP